MTPDYEYAGNYGNNGNPYDSPSGCMVDGQPVACSMAMLLLRFGSGVGRDGGSLRVLSYSGWRGSESRLNGSGILPVNIPGDQVNQQVKDTVPTDLRDRVIDIGNNCTDFLQKYFNALSKIGKLYSTDLGTMLDRVKTIEINQKPFEAAAVPSNASALAEGDGKSRKIYIKLDQTNTAAKSQEFRWNAIAGLTIAELLHHAKDNGRFSDEELDKAAFSLLSPEKQQAAQAEMKGKGYQKGRLGHRIVKEHCKPTDPLKPPPKGT